MVSSECLTIPRDHPRVMRADGRRRVSTKTPLLWNRQIKEELWYLSLALYDFLFYTASVFHHPQSISTICYAKEPCGSGYLG